MRSLLTTVTVAAVLAASASTAAARPAADSGVAGEPESVSAAAPVQPSDGTATLTYVLVGMGGVVSLAGAAGLGAHVARRPPRMPVAGA
jgi:hypothetical protein